MKPFKLGLRIWIAITSVVSFLAGWAMFSRAGKPAPFPFFSSGASVSGASDPAAGGASVTALPTLQPIPSLDQLISGSSNSSSLSGNLQSFPSIQSAPAQSSMPRFRTRGS
jgi:hypothetical protein